MRTVYPMNGGYDLTTYHRVALKSCEWHFPHVGTHAALDDGVCDEMVSNVILRQ